LSRLDAQTLEESEANLDWKNPFRNELYQ